MKRLFNHLHLALVGLVVMIASSCKNEKLADVVGTQSFSTVSMSIPAKAEIGTGSTYTLSGADMTLPLTITFSSATTSAFTVNLSTNTDTVAQLVASGVLPAGTVPFSTGAAAVLPQINIPAGVTSFTTNIVVSRSVMEVGYNSNLGAAIKIGAVGKGNKVVAGKGTMVLLVKPYQILDASSIHDLYFQSPGASNIIDVTAFRTLWTMDSQNFTFSIPVVLQGEPGAEVTVDAISSPDTVTKYINAGKLTNNEIYPNDKISYTPQVKILAGSNVATFSFSTKINTLLAVQPAAGAQTLKTPTVAFTLKNPSKYRVSDNQNRRTVLFTINPNFYRPYYGTPFVIKGTVGVESAPIYAAYYDLGGQGVAYNDNNTKEGDGNWRLPDYVDVAGDYTPRSAVGWIANNEYLTWSVFVEADGVYNLNLLLGSNNTNGRVTAFMDNVLITPTQIAVRNTGAYGNQLAHNSDVTLTKGYHIYKVLMNVGSHDFRGSIFTKK